MDLAGVARMRHTESFDDEPKLGIFRPYLSRGSPSRVAQFAGKFWVAATGALGFTNASSLIESDRNKPKN
jgi:hypothetical protein